MSNFYFKACFLLILFLTISCKNATFKNEFPDNSSVHIDSVQIKNFLKDPRNNKAISNLDYDTECKSSTNQQLLEIKYKTREYHDCIYLKRGKKIAALNSSVFKTDSTWSFGTNGFELHYFETIEKTFPLKSKLKIGDNINDFLNIFGQSKKSKNKYIYNFKFDTFSSELILESQDEIVTKMIIKNSSNL